MSKQVHGKSAVRHQYESWTKGTEIVVVRHPPSGNRKPKTNYPFTDRERAYSAVCWELRKRRPNILEQCSLNAGNGRALVK
jgi:hypothetical protein